MYYIIRDFGFPFQRSLYKYDYEVFIRVVVDGNVVLCVFGPSYPMEMTYFDP